MCRVYNPVRMEQGFMSYSELEYSETPLLEIKLLIPKVVISRTSNPYTDISFLEEAVDLWSTTAIPRYSKVIVRELTELFSFIITDIQTTEDPRGVNMYYKYTLTPSSSVTSTSQDVLDAVVAVDETIENSDAFVSSISDINKASSVRRDPTIKVGKL